MKFWFLKILLGFLTAFPVIAQKNIKIGLLIQDNNELAALRGAELAVKSANLNGGISGQPVELITKSMEGPWGTGSKQAVGLIWEDGVCALIGSHDGRNAHLVEQASAKSITPFISAWSSDPSLSQAFIPWFFNCVPNDEQQAEAITEEIFKERKFGKALVITDNSYDSKQALKSYLKISGIKGYDDPVILNYDSSKTPERFISQIKSSDPDCIIVLSGPMVSLRVIRLLENSDTEIKLYGSFLMLNENKLTENEFQSLKNSVIFPDAGWSESKFAQFETSFKNLYGKQPGAVAVFAFEATTALIQAIRISGGTDNDKIKQALTQLKFKGITGTVQFGKLGIRLNACFF